MKKRQLSILLNYVLLAVVFVWSFCIPMAEGNSNSLKNVAIFSGEATPSENQAMATDGAAAKINTEKLKTAARYNSGVTPDDRQAAVVVNFSWSESHGSWYQ